MDFGAKCGDVSTLGGRCLSVWKLPRGRVWIYSIRIRLQPKISICLRHFCRLCHPIRSSNGCDFGEEQSYPQNSGVYRLGYLVYYSYFMRWIGVIRSTLRYAACWKALCASPEYSGTANAARLFLMVTTAGHAQGQSYPPKPAGAWHCMMASPEANRTIEQTPGDCACSVILAGAQTVDHDCYIRQWSRHPQTTRKVPGQTMMLLLFLPVKMRQRPRYDACIRNSLSEEQTISIGKANRLVTQRFLAKTQIQGVPSGEHQSSCHAPRSRRLAAFIAPQLPAKPTPPHASLPGNNPPS